MQTNHKKRMNTGGKIRCSFFLNLVVTIAIIVMGIHKSKPRIHVLTNQKINRRKTGDEYA